MAASKVVIIRGRGVITPAGDIDPGKLAAMYERGMSLAAEDGAAPADGPGRFIKREDRVGIKINTIGGKKISTRPEVALGLAGCLTARGIPGRNIAIWDRTNRELREAGFRLSAATNGLKIFGTDTEGAGYAPELVSHLSIGSLFSTIQTDFVTASISLAILKDHGLAGVTAGLKNYFGAIHNPNKYHDSRCDPFVAEVFDSGQVKTKHRLTILDCLIVQYHRGPSFHPQWTEKHESLVMSRDPVAADFVGWQIIEKLRSRKGLPSLAEESREPLYIQTAARMGLGKAAPAEIDIIEETL